MFTLNSKEQLKLDVVSRVAQEKISFQNALKILDCSESTLFRYLRSYKNNGVLFVKHKNTNNRPHNRLIQYEEVRIADLCKELYFDFNRTHALEMLKKNHDVQISKSSFNRLCNRRQILKKNIPRKKKRPRHRRDRMKQEGLMLQMDGSPHYWFGTKKSCLVIAIDDATSEVIYGEFSPTETTFACMNVIKKVLQTRGIFQILYVDRAGIFGREPLNNFGTVKREGFSELKRCLQKFSIQTIFAQSAEAKGRVERKFKTLQDRLVPELRLNRIFTFKEANIYFNEVFLPNHKELFTIAPENGVSAFIPLLPSINLDEHFYMGIRRIIKNDHTFSLDGKIHDVINNGINYSGKQIEIRSYSKNQVRYFIDDTEVEIKKAISDVA